MILRKEKRKIGILGFSFKAGTDDLRESPMMEVIEFLIGKGYEIKLYDKSVKIGTSMYKDVKGTQSRVSHLSMMMADSIDEVLEFAETIVIGNGDQEYKQVLKHLRAEQIVVDFVRISESRSGGQYDGICW